MMSLTGRKASEVESLENQQKSQLITVNWQKIKEMNRIIKRIITGEPMAVMWR
jgi:hypothetical protein